MCTEEEDTRKQCAQTMATAVDSGRGAMSDMTNMESWTSHPAGGTASDTVGELVAVLAQRQWTEEENAMLAPWYRQCSGRERRPT